MAETAPRDPVDVAADARTIAKRIVTKHVRGIRPSITHIDMVDEIEAALRSASNSGGEAMREAAVDRLRTLAFSLDREPGAAADWIHSAADAIAAIETPLPAPAPASPWRGMETAPKTGERILLKVRPRSHLGDETEQVAVGRWLDNTGTKMPWQGWSTDLAVCSRAFGWMPLPSPDLPIPPAKKDA